jgi:hypothetical protein
VRRWVPEPAPVTMAVLPLTLYGAGLAVSSLPSGCLAAMIVMYSFCVFNLNYDKMKELRRWDNLERDPKSTTRKLV